MRKYSWLPLCLNSNLLPKQGKKIYVIEYKIHLSFSKCILSECLVIAVHYGVESMGQKVGAFINSFWLLDIINFSEFGEVKQYVVPSTQMQIKTN